MRQFLHPFHNSLGEPPPTNTGFRVQLALVSTCGFRAQGLGFRVRVPTMPHVSRERAYFEVYLKVHGT